jgi:hypothetical protein
MQCPFFAAKFALKDGLKSDVALDEQRGNA